jgi:hypothetical protein
MSSRVASLKIKFFDSESISVKNVCMIEENIPAPKPATRTPRITEELKAMKPGQSSEVSNEIAKAIRSFGRYRGIKHVQQATKPGFVRIWVV